MENKNISDVNKHADNIIKVNFENVLIRTAEKFRLSIILSNIYHSLITTKFFKKVNKEKILENVKPKNREDYIKVRSYMVSKKLFMTLFDFGLIFLCIAGFFENELAKVIDGGL